MTKDAFNKQMGRMRKEFGHDAYSTERMALIWQEVTFFGDAWMRDAVNHFIGNAPKNRPPTVADFGELASAERDRVWAAEKAERARDAKAFMHMRFPTQERQEILRKILERLSGAVPDSDWTGFLAVVQQAADHGSKPKCPVCFDSGVVFARHALSEENRTWACYCSRGLKDPRNFPRWEGRLAAEWVPQQSAA